MIDTRIGLDMSLKEDRFKSNKILVDKFFEIIENIKPTCVFEIGAFSAEFSRNIKSKYPEIKSFAFEANPYNFKHFNDLFKFEDLDIKYINKAISDKSGDVTFLIQKKINDNEVSPIRGNNSIMTRNVENIEYEEVKVNSISLSDFIKENSISNEIIILWIDCEGYNEFVLNGCIDILNEVYAIFIEVEEKSFWENQWLEKDVEFFLTNNGFFLSARDGEYERQYNQIYLKFIKN